MALTNVIKNTVNQGPPDIGGRRLKIIAGQFTGPSSYTTGGESLDLSADIPQLLGIVIEPIAGYVFIYDYTNKKVLAYWTGAAVAAVLAQITATTDLSTTCAKVPFLAWGF